jgi:hypothetical protein
MISALLLASLLAVPSPSDSAVRLTLSSDGTFRPGERARVYVEPAEDGYLVVLRADAEGRVRVVYPVDPDEDDFVRGGKKFEIRWRGEREAFYVEDLPGNGTVVAVWSPDPFKFDAFVRNGHWDYRVLAANKLTDDQEAGLVDIAQRMAGATEVKYDVASYSVTVPRYWRDPLYDRGWFGRPYGTGARLSFFYGVPFYGFGYTPFYYDPFYYDPFYSGFGYGYRYRSIYRQPIYVRSFGGTIRAPARFVIPRDRVRVTPIEPRSRASTSGQSSARGWSRPRGSSRPTVSAPRSSGRGSLRGSPRGGGRGAQPRSRH